MLVAKWGRQMLNSKGGRGAIFTFDFYIANGLLPYIPIRDGHTFSIVNQLEACMARGVTLNWLLLTQGSDRSLLSSGVLLFSVCSINGCPTESKFVQPQKICIYKMSLKRGMPTVQSGRLSLLYTTLKPPPYSVQELFQVCLCPPSCRARSLGLPQQD